MVFLYFHPGCNSNICKILEIEIKFLGYCFFKQKNHIVIDFILPAGFGEAKHKFCSAKKNTETEIL